MSEDGITREMTFDEEAKLYEEEAKWIFSTEKEGGGESPFVNQVVRRGIRIIKKAREEINTHNVDPYIHARWIDDGEYQTCSNCGEEHCWEDFRANYCDNCGAKMDLEDDHEAD